MKKLIFSSCFALLIGVAYAQSTNQLPEKLGMVSYTFRNSFAKDVAATLDTIKGMGITNMEFSNLFGKKATDIRQLLDARGMKCTSFGVSYDDFINKTQEVAQNAKTLGASYVRVASMPRNTKALLTIDTLKSAIKDFNRVGKIMKEQYGLTFVYHNHGYEFAPYEKGTFFDYMMANTDPQYVSFEIDILWVFHPGANPAKLIAKYGDRFRLMHVKDLKNDVKGDFTGSTDQNNDVVLGTGQIDIRAALNAAKKSKIQYFYIEDESKFATKQVPQSIAYLKSISFL
jgi:sugar phosphate isomerase/epimerase